MPSSAYVVNSNGHQCLDYLAGLAYLASHMLNE